MPDIKRTDLFDFVVTFDEDELNELIAFAELKNLSLEDVILTVLRNAVTIIKTGKY